MKYWPVPNSYSKEIPAAGLPGSFWEDRRDRHHCGIDIYAPEGSEVLSIEDGKIISIGIFTSPGVISYWNTTYYILMKNINGFICKYAELGSVFVGKGDSVKAGQLIGCVGKVLNDSKIDDNAPLYIKNIKNNMNYSMLHFELFDSIPKQSKYYLGGNWFEGAKPKNLLNPTDYLQNTKK